MFSPSRNNSIRFLPAKALARCVATVLLLAPCVAVGGEAPATRPAKAADTPAMIRRSLNDLASTEAAVREAARARLTELRREELPALEECVRQNVPLAPSQVTVLRQIVQEIFLAGEPYDPEDHLGQRSGFLGILMDEAAFRVRDVPRNQVAAGAPGVVVADRIPGFCASRMLRDGDVILGSVRPMQPFPNPAALKLAIGGLEPGTTVHLQVLRQGQVIEVPLTLDVRPAEAGDELSAQNFRLRRATRFNEYWQEKFAPLLKETPA